MVDWSKEEYESYPERIKVHLNVLDNIEKGIEVYYIFNVPTLTRTWLQIAILNKKVKAINILLNRLDVPDSDMTVQERISYYQLLENCL